ncbi:hypothetical protein GIB67_024509 [Kingdonia uniflora]|uniref:SAM domain-containing protein n=1 Tax=Kingdonia uniflora TaxID=39325 RepID=A0A7J7LNZ5_9MAGN|nr:hypothetical protein GIB67_024509 [Kingdonia uniflora]
MYADQITSGRKRSVKERLDGSLDDGFGQSRQINNKRLRRNDDKWKHDLREEKKQPQVTIGVRDLRLQLQRKSSQTVLQNVKGSLDLRQHLSGKMHVEPESSDRPKVKTVVEVAKPARKSVPVVPTVETRKVADPAPSRKKSKQKADTSVGGLLESLGLEKYSITFQAEEIDMSALMHMTDGDLKTLGVPMGPRKKILLALDARA